MPAYKIVAVAVVSLVVCLVSWQFACAQVDRTKLVQQWEYQAIDGGGTSFPQAKLTDVLAKLGNEGWELVAVEPATSFAIGSTEVSHSQRVYHLKRQK